jgi:hypothetical protein
MAARLFEDLPEPRLLLTISVRALLACPAIRQNACILPI